MNSRHFARLKNLAETSGGGSAMWWYQGGHWSRCRFAKPNKQKFGLGENDMPVMVVSDIYFKMFASTWGKWSNLNSYFCRWDDHRRAIRIFRIGCIWIYWCVFIFSIDKNVINVDILIRRIFFEWIEVNMDMLFLQACFLLQREIPAPFKEGLSHRYQVKNHLFCRWIRERISPKRYLSTQ